MKSNDNNSLFEVFKPGVRDDLSFFPKLWYWFKNVYWYHFRKITLFCAIGIAIIGLLIFDIVNKPRYDMGFIVAGDTFVSYEQCEQLAEYVKSIVSDVNEDGEVKIAYQSLYTTLDGGEVLKEDVLEQAEFYNEYTYANQQKFQVTFADDNYLVYIIDLTKMVPYAANGYFQPLSEFGIESEDEYFIVLKDNPILKQFNIAEDEENKWCIGIKRIIGSRETEEFRKKYSEAAKVIKNIIGQE